MSNDLEPSNSDDRKWGAIAHFSALVGLLLPLGLVLGPFLVWVLKKNESDFVDEQGKEALNFQITVLIVAFILLFLGAMIRPLLPLAFLVGIGGLIFAVVAGFNVMKGNEPSYPWFLRIIK